MEKVRFDFERLEVYQKALHFAMQIYELTKAFPKDELFGLSSQLRRAATSIALNLAEGCGRRHKNERRQFFDMARASVHECIPCLKIAQGQGYLDGANQEKFYDSCAELSRMICGLINSLR